MASSRGTGTLDSRDALANAAASAFVPATAAGVGAVDGKGVVVAEVDPARAPWGTSGPGMPYPERASLKRCVPYGRPSEPGASGVTSASSASAVHPTIATAARR